MREEDVETAIKVVIVGNGAVGKSSMIQRYCKGIFTKDYKKTIGVDFLERQIQVNGEDVRLMLWDTAGQEEFDAITKAYYRGAQACVITYSTVDRSSFLAVESWKRKVENECGEIPMVLVQNKIDLIDQAIVMPDEAEQLARRLRLRFYRTSVKEDLNVSEVFRYLADKYLAQLNSYIEETEVMYPPRKMVPGLVFNNPHMSNGNYGPSPLPNRTWYRGGSASSTNGNNTITLRASGKKKHHASRKSGFKTCSLL